MIVSLVVLIFLVLLSKVAQAQTFHRGGEVTSTSPDRTYAQLWNPADSGVTCLIRRTQVSGDPQELVIGISLLGGKLPTPMHTFGQGIEVTNGNNPTAKCELRQEGNPNERLIGQLDTLRISTHPYVSHALMALPPGYGMIVRSVQTGTKIKVGFSWDEVNRRVHPEGFEPQPPGPQPGALYVPQPRTDLCCSVAPGSRAAFSFEVSRRTLWRHEVECCGALKRRGVFWVEAEGRDVLTRNDLFRHAVGRSRGVVVGRGRGPKPPVPAETLRSINFRGKLTAKKKAERRKPNARKKSAAIHVYKTEKEWSKALIGRYLKVDDPESLERAYNSLKMILPETPAPTPDGVKTLLDDISAKNPKAAAANPKDFVDMSFVEELERFGFIKQLYGRSMNSR
jgi:hypothetical protein